MQLFDLIEKTVSGLGYELVDFETSPRGRLLRVFIDRCSSGAGQVSALQVEVSGSSSQEMGASPEVLPGPPPRGSGVTVDDCALVSNHLTRVLAVENVDYDRLEVSSPGLDRVLRKLADFERFQGCEAAIKLRLPAGHQRNFTGLLCGVRDGRVLLRVGESEYAFALEEIDRARLVPKF